MLGYYDIGRSMNLNTTISHYLNIIIAGYCDIRILAGSMNLNIPLSQYRNILIFFMQTLLHLPALHDL